MSSRYRRRSLLEMLVCVMLVAALAGQPAWGDGHNTGRHGNSARNAASSTAKGTTARPRGASGAGHSSAAKRKPPPPSPPATGAPAVAGGEDGSPDPTPPPASDPSPVEPGPAVDVAPAEAGSDTPAAPSMPTVASAVPAPAPPAKAAPESGAPSRAGSDGPASDAASAAPTAQQETPGSSAPPTQISTGPSAGAGPTVENSGVALPPVGGTPTNNRSPLGDPTLPPGARANTLTIPPTGGRLAAGQSTTNPIGAPVLGPAARAVRFTTPAGTRATRPRARQEQSLIGRLGVPSDLGINQVANLVKDIPTWIKVALVGLAALVLLLGAYTVLAAARTRRLERQRSKLMEDIGLLQAALLPAVPGRLGALLTTVAYRPADGPGAGGDFYDAFALSDGRVGLLLGDISGHGRQALAKTTLVRFTVRAHLEAGMSPREALAISGRSLDGRLSDDFSTVIAAIHDPVKGSLTYASAGHPAPLVVGPQAHVPVTVSSAPPIGAGFPTGQRQTVLPMPEGSTVCLFSDGLLEARIAGEGLGRERLGEWLVELGPDATAKALLDLVVQRADSVPDDLAACVLHASPGASAPAARLEQLKLDVLDVEGPDLDGFLKACGVSRADRAIAGRRAAQQLSVSGGVVVEVRIGEHPMVSVASIGDHSSSSRPAQRIR